MLIIGSCDMLIEVFNARAKEEMICNGDGAERPTIFRAPREEGDKRDDIARYIPARS